MKHSSVNNYSIRRCFTPVKNIVTVVLCVLGLLAIEGCGDPYASTYTRKKPTTTSLFGTWIIDVNESYVPFSFDQDVTKAKFILYEDGTFKAVDLPGLAFNRKGNSANVSGNGSWQIEKDQEWWIIRINWNSRSDAGRISEPLCLRNDTPPYLLNYILGDPDLGEVVVFVKDKTDM